jgi:hypothetical protein
MPKIIPPDTQIEVIDAVLDLVDDGKSLTQACKEVGFPRKTVEGWIESDSTFSARYLRARANRAEKLFEEALTIQDEKPDCVIDLNADGEGGRSRIDPGFVSWQKNRVDLRMRMIAKMEPHKYGDRVELAHSGEIKQSGAVDLSNLSDAELIAWHAMQEKVEASADSKS